MSDDLSASELRRRFHKGGSIPDSELTASQLRARHGIAGNSRDFSTKENGSGDSANLVLIILLIAFVAAAAGYYALYGKKY